jgi:TRAP-type C4-dicarboxylate transport system substrate-binding protein
MTRRPDRRLTGLAAALAAAGLMAAGTAAQAEEFLLKSTHTASVTESLHLGHEVMKQYIESYSGGRIKVEVYPASQLGNMRETMESAGLGAIEVAYTSGGGVAIVVPEVQVLDIPYLIPNDRVSEKMMGDPVFLKFMSEQVFAKTGNLRMLQLGTSGGWRSFYTVKGPVKIGPDLKGHKVRTVQSPVAMELVSALGGNPTPIPWQELYTSFATGVVAGTKNNIGDIVNNNFHEFLKYGVLDQHAKVWAFWWVNDKWWNSLPKELKKVVQDGYYQLRVSAANVAKWRDLEAYEKFKKAGGQIYVPTAEEKKTWVAGQKPVMDWYVGKYGDSWVKAVNDAVARAEQEIASEDARLP